MPLVTDPSELAPEGERAAIPQPQPDTTLAPSALDVMGAAERQANVAAMVWNRFAPVSWGGNAAPSAPPVPGFDPLSSIPKGYEQYADRFIDAESPQEVQAIKGRIDQELSDRQTIARAGGWGVAATLAAGMTDPLTIASMLIPGGGETRIAQAAHLAAIAAGTTAAQEGLAQAMSETRTPEESLTNIGASAILGGILGAAIRPRVPLQEFERLNAKLSTDATDPNATTQVLGPAQRSVLDTPLPSEITPSPAQAELERLHGEITAHLDTQESALQAITEGPEAQAVAWRNDVPQIAERLQSGQEGLDEAAAILAEDRSTQVAREGERLAGADQANAYAQARAAEAGEEGAVFPQWQARAEENIDRMRENAAQQAELARGVLASAQADIGRVNRVRAAESDLEQLRYTRSQASSPEELAQLLPQGQRELYLRQLQGARADLAAEPVSEAAAAPEVQGAPAPASASVNPEAESTMGAAAVQGATKEGLTTGLGGQMLTKTVGRVTPAGRIMNRASAKARELLAQLANIPGTLEQNYRGIASADPIERRLWGYEGLHVQGIKFRRAAYGEYLARVKREGGAPSPRRAFMDGISQAMRRGDQSTIPEVAKAARWTRQNIFDPLYQRALKLGLVPKEANLYADSYLTRLYDARAIRRNFAGWIETLRQGFIAQGVDPAEATDIAHAATRNVLGSERGLMDWKVLDGIVPKSGNLKERTLALPDQLLEPYLVNDIDHLSHSYLRSMAPEVEMTERFGSRDLRDQFQDIIDQYAHLIEQARASGDVARMARLDAERTATLKDLAAIRDRLYGIYGVPKDPAAFFVRAGRLLRSVNALRLLGAATLAHFPDVGNAIARYGLTNTFGAMAKLVTSFKATKLSLAEAQRMGAAIDMTMNITASILGDYGSHSRFLEQRAASGLARAFTIGTGETPLITAVQAMTSTLAQDEILRMAGKIAAGGTLERNLAAKFAAGGLDEGMLKRIATEGAAHAQTVNGLRFGMSDTWADQKAAQAFESAVLREAHSVTLRPGVGDTPLFMSSELGKSILQFKSFAYAASRLVSLPLAQGIAHGDLRTMEALFALASMGALSYLSKQKAAGQPLETHPGRLALELLDKTNLLGWTGEVIFPALWQAGLRNLSRWSDRDPVETLIGPSAGLVASTWERQFPARLADLATGGALAPDDSLAMRRSDLHFLRRMMPGQNVWYLRRGVNALEDSVGDLFDLPGQSEKERAEELSAAPQ